jgi:hypothetical protein
MASVARDVVAQIRIRSVGRSIGSSFLHAPDPPDGALPRSGRGTGVKGPLDVRDLLLVAGREEVDGQCCERNNARSVDSRMADSAKSSTMVSRSAKLAGGCKPADLILCLPVLGATFVDVPLDDDSFADGRVASPLVPVVGQSIRSAKPSRTPWSSSRLKNSSPGRRRSRGSA